MANPALIPEIHVVDEADRLATFADDSVDFVVADHVVGASCRIARGAIEHMLRSRVPGGVLLLTLAGARHTFGTGRPRTRSSTPLRDHRGAGCSLRLDALRGVGAAHRVAGPATIRVQPGGVRRNLIARRHFRTYGSSTGFLRAPADGRAATGGACHAQSRSHAFASRPPTTSLRRDDVGREEPQQKQCPACTSGSGFEAAEAFSQHSVGAGRRGAPRGAWVERKHRRARRRPCRHRHDADPRRPRPGRADEVPHAAGGQSRAGKRAGERAGHTPHHVRCRRHRRRRRPPAQPRCRARRRDRAVRGHLPALLLRGPRASSSDWPSRSPKRARPGASQPTSRADPPRLRADPRRDWARRRRGSRGPPARPRSLATCRAGRAPRPTP